MHKRLRDKIERELQQSPDKRTIGGHGDPNGFLLLSMLLSEDDEANGREADVFKYELPQRIVCSTCRFLTPEFHERMPCWTCIEDADLPKWRSKGPVR